MLKESVPKETSQVKSEEVTTEQIVAAKAERWFKPFPCPICPSIRSVMKINGARICLLCYDVIKRNSKLELEAVQVLTLIQAKKYYTQKEPTSEPPVTKQRKVRRSRTIPQEPVRE